MQPGDRKEQSHNVHTSGSSNQSAMQRLRSTLMTKSQSQIDDDPIQRLRNTMMAVQVERSSQMSKLRNSMSNNSVRYHQKQNSVSNGNMKKKATDNLKSTLDELQSKINSAKKELEGRPIMKKKNKQMFLKIEQLQEQYSKTPYESNISNKNTQSTMPSIITSYPKPLNTKPVDINPYSPRRHNQYYISEILRAANEKNSLAMQHINSSIKILKACECEQIPQNSQIEYRKVNLKKKQFYKNKKTLILDMDETLIHCNENLDSDCDMKLPIKIDQTHTIQVGINIRPYALSFLKKMATKFEIIIFTASHQSYADVVLNELDPDNQIFQHRLYRQHCYLLKNQLYVKDLRIINRNFNEMVLVDNAAYSYAFQLQNGIPILPFYQGNDYELSALQSYLDKLQKIEDVRQLNKKTFQLHHYTNFEYAQQLIQQLYTNRFR